MIKGLDFTFVPDIEELNSCLKGRLPCSVFLLLSSGSSGSQRR